MLCTAALRGPRGAVALVVVPTLPLLKALFLLLNFECLPTAPCALLLPSVIRMHVPATLP